MNDEILNIRESIAKLDREAHSEEIRLYPGIDLCYLSFASDSFSLRHRHGAMEHMMQINYCKSGQMEWRMGNGSYIYLNPGDFSLHTMHTCADSVISFPTGQYSGLTICIDLQETAVRPPEILKDTDIFTVMLREKFCRNNAVAFLAGNEQTESIFAGFYDQPEDLKLPYRKIKVLELFLYLSQIAFSSRDQLTTYQAEQIDIIRKIHDRLTGQMGERITIEELAKQYLINPTTLKAAFKTVYGTSIAAHIKEHRMEQAAKLLLETDMNIAEIAQAVGYESQSKFTAAFKAFFQILPREYRKKHRK